MEKVIRQISTGSKALQSGLKLRFNEAYLRSGLKKDYSWRSLPPMERCIVCSNAPHSIFTHLDEEI